MRSNLGKRHGWEESRRARFLRQSELMLVAPNRFLAQSVTH